MANETTLGRKTVARKAWTLADHALLLAAITAGRAEIYPGTESAYEDDTRPSLSVDSIDFIAPEAVELDNFGCPILTKKMRAALRTARDLPSGILLPGEDDSSATWCPKCGDCACPYRFSEQDGERTLDSPCCPLHAPNSKHATEPSRDDDRMLLLKALLQEVFDELDSCNSNDGERTGDEFRFGHRCVNCDENVDRNSVLRNKIRAAIKATEANHG